MQSLRGGMSGSRWELPVLQYLYNRSEEQAALVYGECWGSCSVKV